MWFPERARSFLNVSQSLRCPGLPISERFRIFGLFISSVAKVNQITHQMARNRCRKSRETMGKPSISAQKRTVTWRPVGGSGRRSALEQRWTRNSQKKSQVSAWERRQMEGAIADGLTIAANSRDLHIGGHLNGTFCENRSEWRNRELTRV